MDIADGKLHGLRIISPRLFKDERGLFFEEFRKSQFPDIEFVQDNVSLSCEGTIRGLHLQINPFQDKLVSCLSGKIWDVAVDLRPNSPTYMQWEAFVLDDLLHQMLLIPKGFAHGFCVLSASALVHYKVSAYYNAASEVAIRWDDPEINISWPVKNPILSSKDQKGAYFKEVKDVVDYRR